MFKMFRKIDRLSDGKAAIVAIVIIAPGAALVLFGETHPQNIIWGMLYLGVILTLRLIHLAIDPMAGIPQKN